MTAAKNRYHFALRVRMLLGAIAVIALILVVRLYTLQVVHGTTYRAQATERYTQTAGGFYDRGNIFFKDKDGREISAATIKSGYLLALNPRKIRDVAKVVATVAPYSKLNKQVVEIRARKKNDPYESIAEHLTKTQAQKIRAQKINGILVIPERWRYYPGGSLAARTIGFVAYDGNTKDGRYGLERYYEDVLSRKGNSLNINFFAELFSNVKDMLFVPVQKQEGDIVTTIEPTVQLYLEKVLRETQQKWHSKFTVGIVLDPQTGEVRAMATVPSFDLNSFGVSNDAQYANPLIEHVYEMGSIMKPLTLAAGLDSGAIQVADTYDDTGSVVIDGSKISNYDGRARGVIPMQQILSQSLNVGAAYVEARMGNDTFRRYMYRYGINEETGIDLPNEARNLTNNLNSPRNIEYATASFGQGVALTPISMARALAVLPNGYLEQPHVVSAIHLKNGTTHKMNYADARTQVLKPATAEAITRMLVTVMDKAMLGGTVKLKHYSIAAKTGTAQIASPHGGYYKDKYLHSYFGYFPAYDAKYLIFLMTVEPQGAEYASHTLTEPFMKMTKFLINYYNIPPDR